MARPDLTSLDGRCTSCGRDIAAGERHRATKKMPTVQTMEHWLSSGVARATDGCRVEPDGWCPHGHSSWLLRLGLI